MSPFLYNIAHCFVVIIINNQLKTFGGDMAIASYGVINRLTFIFAMIVMGLNQGMQPITGYNYGAKLYDRMLQSFYLTCLYATASMGIVFILGECFPELMTRMFTHDPVLIEQTIRPMRIVCSSMLIIGFQMVTGNLFTSIGKAGKAIFLSLTRQVIYLIPLTLLMPMVFTVPLDGVWWSIPISDTLSAITAVIILLTSRRKLVNPL
jgi:Na+-driven multidrug efflux pump